MFAHKGPYLGLYCGPMFSGKTRKLLSLKKQFDLAAIESVVINHASDSRFSDNSGDLYSHDRQTAVCTSCSSLYEFHDPKLTTSTEVFLINEGQFFNDIVEWTQAMVSSPQSKKVFISGLDADYERRPFGTWMELLPIADHVEKLSSVCTSCRRKPAIFSSRITSEQAQIVIGSDNYKPLCRGCFESMHNKSEST